MIDFGRAIYADPFAASRREYLAMNGIGGFACGTIPGELTRRHNGLLVAALNPPLGHHLSDHGLASVSEIFDGDPPHTPRSGFALAWGIAELIRAWQEAV